MRLDSLRTALLLLAGCVLSLGVARANDFNNVVFTDSSTGNSIIGSGTFSFDNTVGDGTYLLTNLTNYNFDFTVNGVNFTNSNLDTSDLANVEAVIYDNGNNFYFNTDCQAAPNGTGCYESTTGGTLGFFNGTDYISTEPNYYGPTPLNVYEFGSPDNAQPTLGYYGTPAGLTPEPESLWLLGTGLAAMLLLRFRRASLAAD